MKKHDLNHSYQYHIYEIISYMSTKPRIEAKNDFEKDFFKLVNNGVFGKSMKNERKNRACNNKQKKILFSFINKLLYNKVVSRKFNSNGNEKTKSKNE